MRRRSENTGGEIDCSGSRIKSSLPLGILASIHPDGKFLRFSTNGKHDDEMRDGTFSSGSHHRWSIRGLRTGVKEEWRADIGRTLTPAEEAAHRAKLEVIQRERETKENRRRTEARKKPRQSGRTPSSSPIIPTSFASASNHMVVSAYTRTRW